MRTDDVYHISFECFKLVVVVMCVWGVLGRGDDKHERRTTSARNGTRDTAEVSALLVESVIKLIGILPRDIMFTCKQDMRSRRSGGTFCKYQT
jgi:hypothetical protein